MTIKAKKSKINLREKLAELLNFRQIRDRLDGLGLYLGKDRTGTAENLAVRGGANVDDLQLTEISAALGGTAVDVFVYDTRNDSDGGKWRERTQHTSWYNEELNTSTRGGRREFPSVAVIVGEADKVTIYDGDDPDLSMWMVFNADVAGKLLNTIGGNTSLAALNGDIFVGCSENVYGGVSVKIAFISDTSFAYANNQITQWPTGISERDSTVNYAINVHSYGLVNLYVNDVAMTVLPNAPIDAETGLPVPTIAVATDGGISVIKDDGSVVDITGATNYNKAMSVTFTLDKKLLYSLDYSLNSSPYSRYIRVDDIPSVDFVATSSAGQIGNSSELYSVVVGEGQLHLLGTDGANENLFIDNHIGNEDGLTFLERNKSAPANGMVAYTTSSYNTGWMPGDIKLAALSDTKTETVGVDESELVSNGTFDSNTNDWSSPSSTTLSVDNQRLKLQGGGDPYPSAYTLVNVVEGIEYEVSAQYISNSNSFSGRIRVSSSSPLGGDIINGDIKTPGNNHIYRFTAPSTGSVYVALMLQDVNGNSSGIWDNVSVKQTGELITNGTFDDGTEGWTVDGVSTDTTSGDLVMTGAGDLTQQISLIVGKTYVISADLISVTDCFGNLKINTDSTGSGGTVVDNSPSATNLNGTFVAASSSIYIAIQNGTATTSSESVWNNISVRLAEEDRSVNDNGLQVFGEIDKTPVAPGADLVAYSGFSADDYLMQPYNEDLNFGTGDFLSTWWIYRNDTLAGSVFHRSSALVTGNTATSDAILQAEFGASQFQAQVYTNGFGLPSDNSTLTYTGVPSGVWTHMAMSRKSNVLSLYVNGKFIDSVQSDATVTNTNAPMSIGTRAIRSGLERPLNGSLALLRFSATAPTPDQIAKIYRDEKVLFQDGAQATLYGTSDAVTALTYDDKTELLHVGTSSGRSDFAGLRRINNTTTAVTTSISASNNLIAEQ